MTYTIEQIAQVCHEANRALQLVNGELDVSPAWDDAPGWQRESAVAGVREANGGMTAAEQHEAWCEYKLGAGWRYGETKDAGAKTHPCLVPYAELPEGQRVKDAVFGAIVQAMTGWPAQVPA